MHITNISALNVHDLSFNEKVSLITLFWGDNMVGKTARLNAVRVGLLGYLPRLGVQPGSTFKMSGDPSKMSVSLNLSDGQSLSWLWTCDRETVRRSGPAKAPAIPEILLDASGFFALKTANKRIEYIFQNVATSTLLSPDKLMAALKSLKIDPMTESAQGLLSSMVSEIDESVNTWRMVNSEDPSQTFQGWLDEEMDRVSDLWKKEKQNVDRMAKAIQAAVQLGKAPTRDLPSLEQEAKKLRDESSALDSEIAILNERRGVASRSSKRRSELESLLAQVFDPNITAKVESQSRDTHQRLLLEKSRLEGDLNRAKETLAGIKKQVSDQRAKSVEMASMEGQLASLDSLKIRSEELALFTESYQSHTQEITSEMSGLQRRNSELSQALSAIQFEHAKGVERVAKLRATSCCPTCGTYGQGFSEAVEEIEQSVRSAYAERYQPAKDALDSCSASLDHAIQSLAASKKNDEDAAMRKFQLGTVTAEISKLSAVKARYDALNEWTPTINLSAILDWETTVANTENLLANCVRGEQRAGLILKEVTQKLKVIQSRKEWESELAGLGPVAEIESSDDLVFRRRGLSASLDDINLKIKQAVAEKQEAISRSRSEMELSVSQVRAEILKAIVAKMKEFRADLVDSVFGSLMNGINRVVRPVLGMPLNYEEGDLFFRSRSGRRIPCEMFSGTQDAIVQAAVCLSMAATSPIKIVVFDELGRVSPARKLLLLKTIQQLIGENVIDQFLGVDVDDKPYLGLAGQDGVSLVHVTQT